VCEGESEDVTTTREKREKREERDNTSVVCNMQSYTFVPHSCKIATRPQVSMEQEIRCNTSSYSNVPHSPEEERRCRRRSTSRERV